MEDDVRTYKRNNEERQRHHCCCGKSITYYECVSVALVCRIQCECAVFYCFWWPLQLCHILRHYLIKVTEHKMCVLISLQICVKHFSFQDELSKILSIHERRSSCKVSVTLVRFIENSIFSTDFRKNHQISCKSVQWEPSCSIRTDRHEAKSRLLQFFERIQ